MSVLSDDDIDRLATALSEKFTEGISDEIADEVMEDLPPRFMQRLHRSDWESFTPSQAIEKFRQYKAKSVADSTMDAYDTKIGFIKEFLTEEIEIEELTELTPVQAEGYETWREWEGTGDPPLKPKTLKDDMYVYQEFLEHLSKLNAVSPDAYEIIEIPELKTGEGVDKTTLAPDRAATILVYLDRFEYATLDHVTMRLLAKTGRRPCDIRAPDVDDFERCHEGEDDIAKLTLRHRPETGTGLKEGKSHEAELKLSDETEAIIKHFISYHRPDVVDEHGREPLLATTHGRMSTSTIKAHSYKWTSPCAKDRPLPDEYDDHDPTECPASDDVKKLRHVH